MIDWMHQQKILMDHSQAVFIWRETRQN